MEKKLLQLTPQKGLHSARFKHAEYKTGFGTILLTGPGLE